MRNPIIEISKKKAKAGRVPITMILHEIHKDDSHYNKNGITWVKEYCENNLESINGMQLVTQFLDSKHEIPFGGHGNMIVEENKVIFEDSLVVGSFESGYIAEDIEVNGEKIDAVVGKGYIYNQRFPHLVDYLQKEYDEANNVEGSVEINAAASSGNTKIIYDGGWKEKGRKPQIFDYSGHAIIIGDAPADHNALMVELNAYKDKGGEVEVMNKNIINKGVTIEINKLSYDDICVLITRAFNSAMGIGNGCYSDYDSCYDIYRFYPETSEVVFRKWRDVGNFYMTTYKIENSTVTISEIIKVEEDWKPAVDSQPVEVNAESIKRIIKGGSNMDAIIQEKDKIIADLNTQITEVNAKNVEMTSKIDELSGKVEELNTTIVEVNKTLEAAKGEKEALTVEVNSLKEYKETKEQEIKQAEVNAYFESEIPKNKFEEAEVNTLKEYVEKTDLEGLKKAEAEMIVKRFKEGKLTGVEINSDNNTNVFFSTKEEKLDDIEAGKSLFV